MRPVIKSLGLLILSAGLFFHDSARAQTGLSRMVKSPETAAQLKSFVADKEAQADQAAEASGRPLPPEFQAFFTAAQQGDWLTISNLFEGFRQHAGQYAHAGTTDERLRGPAWEGMKEIWGAFYFFNVVGEKYSTAFGRDIIQSIPPGSIYFGGTDPGRFLVTSLCKSQVKADPFFLLTQNAQADNSYLAYLRGMYAGQIYVPTEEDSQQSFRDYKADALRRLKNHQLKPGENIRTNAAGEVLINNHISVVAINALLVRRIFDKNPQRDFYIEESFPMDWMYPQLEPHGLIMKINRQPLPSLSDEIVQSDRDYWMKYMTPMVGGWLTPDTSLADVTAFAEKIYGKKDLNGFTGDPQFIQSPDAQKMFSKLRSSLGGMYAWRATQAKDDVEKRRMNDAADFAFRQALTLCPNSPEVVFRYAALLMAMDRRADAILVAETAAHTAGDAAGQFVTLAENLKRAQVNQ